MGLVMGESQFAATMKETIVLVAHRGEEAGLRGPGNGGHHVWNPTTQPVLRLQNGSGRHASDLLLI